MRSQSSVAVSLTHIRPGRILEGGPARSGRRSGTVDTITPRRAGNRRGRTPARLALRTNPRLKEGLFVSGTATEVIVVGGGVIGCAIAYELARRGAGVILVERGPIGREASWASAGIISLPNRPEMRPERIEIGRRSLARYPGLVAELEEQTGFAIEYRRPGEMAVAVDAAHAALERQRAAWQRSQGFVVEELSPDAARRLEPTLPAALAAAWYAPDVGSLSVYRLTQALAVAAAQQGSTVLPETPVGEVAHRDGRVRGVRLADRELVAEMVVLASGAWTRFFGNALGAPLPTRPVKGQLIAFANAPARPARVVAGHGGYVRPRVDGTTIVAATEEDAGFDRRVTGEGIAWLLELTRTLCPTLLQGEVVESWSGLRPGSVTGEPMIGPVPGFAGLWVAAGHFRTGAKEAPATAELVGSSLLDGRIDPLLAPFAPPASMAD